VRIVDWEITKKKMFCLYLPGYSCLCIDGEFITLSRLIKSWILVYFIFPQTVAWIGGSHLYMPWLKYFGFVQENTWSCQDVHCPE
jgi:hypothetical protein